MLKKRGGSTSGDTFLSKISEMHQELDATAPATGWVGKTATATVTSCDLTDGAPCGSRTLEATRSATSMGGRQHSDICYRAKTAFVARRGSEFASERIDR